MGFHLIDGNDLGRMAERFADLLMTEGDPFDEDVVVTTDSDVRRWLAVKVAERNGFFPSVEWMRPGDFIYKYLFNPALGRPQGFDVSGFEPEVTVWAIYKALGEIRNERVDNYVARSALKRWQLASRLASLFNQYMTYRQDYLAVWERDVELGLGPDESWQAEIWRRISKGREDVFSKLCARFLSPSFAVPPKKRRFFYFGIALLPKVHLAAAMKLAETADIWFFMMNPCSELWDDTKTNREMLRLSAGDALLWQGNRLLGDFGQSGRCFFSEMLEDGWNDEEPVFDESAEHPKEAMTLLDRIKSDIQSNTPIVKDAIADNSISINAAYSPLREAEILKDSLFKAFCDYPDLKPMDVRVYVPDISAYAPFVETAFGDGKIPFRISGRGLAGAYPVFAVFGQVLAVLNSRFKASEIAGILSSAPVMKRLGLEPKDASTIVELIVASNVAWGRNSAHKNSAGAAATYLKSWDFAIDRLVFGVAASDPSPTAMPIRGADGRETIPEPLAEGNARIVGLMVSAVELLCCAGSDLERKRTPAEWYAFLKKLRDALLPEQGEEGLVELDKALSDFVSQADLGGASGEKIPFAVVRSWFASHTKDAPSPSNPMSGCVTFSQFPSSAVVLPARVVGMLGMNDVAFPGRDKRDGCNLMAINPRFGDPSVRRRGRYAFLEALVSAKDRVVITYTARSQKDKGVLPPSIVLRELIDSLGEYLGEDGVGRIVTDHPLHPFALAYFDRNNCGGLFTFDKLQQKVAHGMSARLSNTEFKTKPFAPDGVPWHPPRDEADPCEWMKIGIRDIDAALKNPLTYFVQHTIGAALNPWLEDSMSDVEPVEMSAGLESFKFNQTIAEGVLASMRSGETEVSCGSMLSTAEKVFLKMRASGQLPIAEKWEDHIEGYESLFRKMESLDWRTMTVVAHMSAGINAKGVVETLLRHLHRIAEDDAGDTCLMSVDSIVRMQIPSGDAKSFANETLRILKQHVFNMRQRPMCFDLKAFWSVAEKYVFGSADASPRMPSSPAEFAEAWPEALERIFSDVTPSIALALRPLMENSAEFEELSMLLTVAFLICSTTEVQ